MGSSIGHNSRIHISLPDIPLINNAFQPDIRDSLLSLKEIISKIKNIKTRDFFNLGFLSILESVSNTSKSSGFLRYTKRKITVRDLKDLFEHRLTKMINDVEDYDIQDSNHRIKSLANIGDARKLPTNRKFDAIITSPPYPNRHDYTRIYSLEMAFDYVNSNEELKRVRYQTLRSHVEAKRKYDAKGYIQPRSLANTINRIRKRETNNPQIIAMLEGFFEDMYLCLSEMSRCLYTQGKIALVISNVRFAGVSIFVDEILSDICSQVGLTAREIWAIRYRGNSSQQMRDYKRKPSRESIIIIDKNGN